ncbi:MAG TPA: dihydrolipoyl dehydrogenase [Bryobacteraceae bacterium]|jgi:dihydrolipoamide dehydrogenase|nr:dihydrolipoyl dehydrogenase [Bryobacteraceae bacterium]
MYDLIVIGAGPGGYEAAAHGARMGGKVALIEKERVGGICLHAGCIPAKTFLRSSKLFQEVRDAGAYGIRVGSVEFDMAGVVERKNRVVGTLARGVQGMLKRAGVEVISGRARLVSRGVVEAGTERYQARNILIATGSRPAVPPIPGIHSECVLDSNTVFALTRVPERIAIIGGGYIGLEFACFFNEAGAQVSVYEMLPQIAAGCDREISRLLLQVLKRKGIEFHLSCRVLEIESGAGASACQLVILSADGRRERLPHDTVLNATGRAPIVHDLGLEGVGVDFSPKRIRTSDQGKTNVPGVWACGDVTGRRMLAHAATREGIVAVNNMFGKKDRIRYGAIPAVIYTHPEVSSVGKTEEELKVEGTEYRKSVVPMAVAGRFLVENEGETGMVKVLVGARYGEILGVHALGDASSEFIVAAAAMVESGMSLTDASRIVFPHPTVSEALREAIEQAAHKAAEPQPKGGADALVRAGPPGPALRSSEQADQGGGRGPGGPPH